MAYTKEVLGVQGAPSHLTLCRQLSLFPLLVLGLLKSVSGVTVTILTVLIYILGRIQRCSHYSS